MNSCTRVLLALAVAACVATCGEPTAPRRSRRAALALQPVMPANVNLAAFGLTIDSAHVVVTGPTGPAYDRTVFFPPDVAEIQLEVSIVLREDRDTVSVDLQLLSGRTTLFAGAQQVEVRAGAPPEPVIVPLTYVGDSADTLAISPVDSVVTFGGVAQFRVSATDSVGNPVTQFYVAWSTDSASLPVNAAGVFQAPARRTSTTVTARTLDGDSASTPVTVVPPPATLVKVSGDGQADTVGNAAPQPLVVQVRAADGLGVRGVPVAFAALTGGGGVTAPVVVTDTGGFAQTTATLGPLPGTQTYRASVAGVPATATFTVTAAAAVASRLVFTAQPSAASTGLPIVPPVVVTALDRFGNVAAGYAGNVTIALGANPGGATLSGTTTVAAVNAVATFADLRLDRAGAGYVLVAAAAGLTSASSVSFPVNLGAPAGLGFAVQPSDVVAGNPIIPPVTVEILDAVGNRVTSATSVVTIAIGVNPVGGALTGTLAVSAVAGVATFSDLSITAPAPGYTLIVTVAGLPTRESTPFNVTLTAGGITWTNPAGGAWSNPANWNPTGVPASGDTVRIALDGTYTVTLDVNATVAFLFLGAPTGTQTLAVNGRTLGVDSGVVIQTTGVLDLSSATLQGAGVLVNSGTVVAAGSTVNTDFVNLEMLRVRDTTVFNGALATDTGSTVRIEGDALCCGALLTAANGFTNTGRIELTAINGTGQAAGLSVTTGPLVNAPGAVIDVQAGTSGARSLDVELVNQGTVTVGQAVTMGRPNSVHDNSGTISVTGGDLTVTQSGGNPSFTNDLGGVIDIGAGRKMKVDGFTIMNAGGGKIMGRGTLDVATTTFTNLGDLSPGTSPGILTINVGTLGMTHATSGRLNIEIGGLSPSQYDQLQVTGPGLVQLTGTVTVVLTGGFVATLGQSFVIMTYGGALGGAGVFSPPPPPGFILDYGQTGQVIARCQQTSCF